MKYHRKDVMEKIYSKPENVCVENLTLHLRSTIIKTKRHA